MDNKEKYARLARWLIVALVIAVAAPLIMMLVKGLVGLAIASVVGFGAIAAAPVVSMRFATWKLAGIKAVARANPVETLQVIFADKKVALRGFLASIHTFTSEVLTFSQKVEQFVREYPEESRAFVDHLGKMNQLLDVRKAEYRRAEIALTNFESEIRKVDAKWKMSQAAAALSKSAGADTGDVFEKIKAETAIEQVQLSVNHAFAQLDIALLESERNDLSMLQLTALPVAERVRVGE